MEFYGNQGIEIKENSSDIKWSVIYNILTDFDLKNDVFNLRWATIDLHSSIVAFFDFEINCIHESESVTNKAGNVHKVSSYLQTCNKSDLN